VRDRAIFVGNPEDIVPLGFGKNLPAMRDWIPKHFDFSGYVLGQHPQAFGPRDALRKAWGYRPDEKICIVTVGGSGVGTHLIARILQAWPLGPARGCPSCAWCWLPVRASTPLSLGAPADVEVSAFVPNPRSPSRGL